MHRGGGTKKRRKKDDPQTGTPPYGGHRTNLGQKKRDDGVGGGTGSLRKEKG